MATTTLATKLMSADEFFDWCNLPENRDRHLELERGEVVEVARPGERHGVVCSNADWVLNSYARQRRRGFVCANDTGIVLERSPDTVRGPDVSFYDELRRFEDLSPKYCDHLPKLAVEVLSPNDRWGKVTRRITRLLAAGIPLVWLIDPEDRSVTVYRPGQLAQVFDESDELTGDGILPDFRCKVADFFFLPGEGATAETQQGPGTRLGN